MRKFLGVAALLALASDVQGQTTWSGSVVTGTTSMTLGCVNPNLDECVHSALVIRTKDKMILIRGVKGCKEVAEKIGHSSDVANAECF
jgi:hypothetical protein